MRQNAFGEPYCTTVEELRTTIDNCAVEWECYLSNVQPPEGDETMWVGEVAENQSGDTICYIEAESEAAVRAIAREAKLDGA